MTRKILGLRWRNALQSAFARSWAGGLPAELARASDVEPNARRLPWLLVLVAVLLVTGTGCPRGSRSHPTQGHLQTLAVLYGRYREQHQGFVPRDADSLKMFIITMDPTDLATLNVTDVDAVFVSPRDGQPYVVHYGDVWGAAGPTASSVIAYEQQGVSGKRWVAWARGTVEEVDEARFRKLAPEWDQGEGEE